MTKRSSNKFRLLSFLFTAAVIIYHSYLGSLVFSDKGEAIRNCMMRLYDFLAGCALAYFFATSGYLLYHNATSENAGQKVKRRFHTLLIPFIVWNCLYFPAAFFFQREKLAEWGNVLQIVYHFFFFPLDGPLWYVFAIFLLSLLTVPLVKAKESRHFLLCVFLFVVFASSIFVYTSGILRKAELQNNLQSLSWLNRLLRYFPCYILGGVLGGAAPHAVDHPFSLRGRIACGVLLICTAAIWIFAADLSEVVKQILLISAPMAVWIVFDAPSLDKPLSSRINGAFLMYASHSMINSMLHVVFNQILPVIPQSLLLLVWLVFPYITVTVVYLICSIWLFLSKKYGLEKITRILSGNRN